MARLLGRWHLILSGPALALLASCQTPSGDGQGMAPPPPVEVPPGAIAQAPPQPVSPPPSAPPGPGRAATGPAPGAPVAGAPVSGGRAAGGDAATPASATQTLPAALALTYQTNPTLAAQRASLRATNEQIAQALAGYRPTVNASGEIGAEYQDTDVAGSDTITPGSIGIQVSQPIYSGGRTPAQVSQAENVIEATRATLLATEQQVLLDAIIAYMNLLREQAVLELQINNEQVLQRQLQAARDRFAVGEITRTDVSQSESRLAAATAERIQAAGALRVGIAEYIRIIGQAPATLVEPGPLLILPSSLEETINLAEASNPNVIAAVFAERAAADGVDVAFSELLPNVALTGTLAQSYQPSVSVDRATTGTIRLQVTVPLYLAGAAESRVRQARFTTRQRRIEVAEARRQAVQNAIGAWEGLVTSRAAIESRISQVQSAEIALEGVQQEAQVGARTVLDVLDAEQELLDARVELVRARRNEVVAAFQVLSAIGRLTAPELALPVEYYDVERDYQTTRSRWWGTSVDDDEPIGPANRP